MTTTVTVNSGGGADYTTIQAAIDASDVSTEDYIVEVQNNAAYAENLTLGGSTGTPTIANYLHLTATDAAYHAGDATTGARVAPTAADHSIEVTENFARVSKMLVQLSTGSGNSNECIRVGTGTNILVDRCVLDAQARNRTTTDGDCFYTQSDSNTPLTLYNTVMIDADRGWVDLFNYDGTINLEFCTGYRCAITETNGGQRQGYMYPRGGATTAVANIYNTVGGFNGYAEVNGKGASQTIFHSEDAVATINGANNAADNNLAFNDISATGFVANIVHADAWTDPTNFDLTILDTDSDLYLAGTDRSGSLPDSRVDATIDIAGVTRPATPSIGAYEFVAAGPDRSITADHDAFLATQSATLVRERDITADQDAFLATQTAAAKLIGKATAAQDAFLATQAAPLDLISKVSAAQAAFLATQTAALEGIISSDVSGDHQAFLATQASTLDLIADVTAAQSAFLATQAAPLDLIADIAADQDAFLATQAASITTQAGITADHQAFLATQASVLDLIASVDGAQTAFLATQSASLDLIADITAGQSAFLATQASALTVALQITSDQSAFLATQSALILTQAGIVGQHTAFLATQSSTVEVVVDVAGDQAAFLATQATDVDLIAKVNATQTAFLATSAAAFDALASISASQAAFLAAQASTLELTAPGLTGDHIAFLAQQSAVLGLLSTLSSDQSAFLAVQTSEVDVVAELTAAQTAFLPTQAAQLIIGQRPSIGLAGQKCVDRQLVAVRAMSTLQGQSP